MHVHPRLLMLAPVAAAATCPLAYAAEEGIVTDRPDFVESSDTAYVFGIETPDARPRGLPADAADKQQLFIQFLREQTYEDIRALGMLAKVFRGHEYGCEIAATAAYVVARDVCLNLGVGYQTESGAYELVGIHKDDDLVVQARLAVLTDEPQHP